MPQKKWSIQINHNNHNLLFDTGGIKKPPFIQVDDQKLDVTILPKTSRVPMYTDFVAKFNGHDLLVRLSTNGFWNFYDLAVDGINAVTNQPLGPGNMIPLWSWAFLFLCIGPAFLRLDNIILSATALVTGFTCIAVACKVERKMWIKVTTCAVLSAIAWGMFWLVR